MIFEIFITLGSIALAITGSLTFMRVDQWYEFYVPILLLVVGYIGFTILALGLVTLFALPFRLNKEYKKPSNWCRFWLQNGEQYISFHAGARVKVIGYSRIPKTQRFLLVCNHRSNFDPMIITQKWGKLDIAFITKRSNYGIPIGRHFMAGMIYMAIDRDDPLQSLSVMKKSMELIKNDISSVGVFPEGKRQTEKVIGDFHEGVFNIAIKANAPIVVCTMNDAHYIHERFPWKRTHITLKVLEVIPPEDFEGRTAKEVSDEVREMMIDDLTAHKVTY